MKWVATDRIEHEVPTDVDVDERYEQAIPVQATVTIGTSDLLSSEDLLQVSNEKGYLVWDNSRFVSTRLSVYFPRGLLS